MYEADPILKLSDVDYSRADTFGERACSLSRLMSKGYNVPFGVVVSTKVFKRFLNITPGAKRIDNLIRKLNYENVEEIANEIQDIILYSPIPMPIANQIAEKIYKLWDRISSDSVVVRTSAHVEDSSRHICWGRGIYFYLREMREIISVIRNCWASAFSADVLNDLLHKGLPPDTVRIAVIIAEMITPKVTGSISIESENGGGVHIKANWGSKVYESRNGIFCDQIIFDDTRIGEPTEIYVSFKEKISQIPPNTRHAIVVENTPERKNKLSLSQEDITALVQLAKKVQHDFEIDYDIEFVFDEKGTLWLLDAIPKAYNRKSVRIGTSVNIVS
ncbi:MAG: PEP/pyruvate-binding domain-containing protein [Candidatus Hodarchaeales archaeon]